MTAAHSYWPASGMEQRMLCPGSHVLQKGQPDNASVYSAEGTAAHQLLTWALKEGKNAAEYIGTKIGLDGGGRVLSPGLPAVWTFTVDDDMAGHVQTTIDYVREVAGDNPIIVDTKVNYANYLDVPEEEAWGTLDVTVLLPDEIISIDLKYGMGVEVSAGESEAVESYVGGAFVHKPNPQLALYGLGALNDYRDFGDYTRARLVISQPRVSSKPSEYDLTIEELERWGTEVARPAVAKCQRAEAEFEVIERERWDKFYLNPGEKQCKFCKAKATCPALRNEVGLAVFGSEPATPDEFADAATVTAERIVSDSDMGPSINAALQPIANSALASWLSVCLQKVDLIEDWCKGIRTEVERRLFAGEAVPDFKLVQGKRGNRTWSNAEDAEAAMKAMRLKQEEMYDLKLISPTTAEKLAKAQVIGPRQWPRLQNLITQSDGKPHVAHVSDKRPALTITQVADDFADTTTSSGDEFAWMR